MRFISAQKHTRKRIRRAHMFQHEQIRGSLNFSRGTDVAIAEEKSAQNASHQK